MEIREEWQGKKSIPTLNLQTSISTWGNEYPEPSEKENPVDTETILPFQRAIQGSDHQIGHHSRRDKCLTYHR